MPLRPNTDAATLAVYDARAKEYAQLTCADAPDTQLRAFLEALPPKARLLDLGCGPGRSAAMMAREGHSVIATDASAAMVRLAQAQPGVTAHQATFDALPDGPFDGIWANFSLLHATPDDLPRHLSDIAARLPTGGLFHIGMKLGTGMKRDALGRRYTYVTEAGLADLLSAAGLTPAQTWTGADKGLSGTVDPWICILSHR